MGLNHLHQLNAATPIEPPVRATAKSCIDILLVYHGQPIKGLIG